LVVLAIALLSFGAPDAQAVPSVTFKCTPAPQNCSGWYRSNVSIEWTVAPANSVVDGCRNKTLTTDTAGTNEVCVADDGEAKVAVEVRIKIDKTAPVVTGGAPARAADVNGWYNHAVPIVFSGSDQTSGIDACTNTAYGGPDSVAASLAGTCIDRAGNVSSPLGYGLKYDETAPVVAGPGPERAANTVGWFNRPVRFDPAGSDATSGIADCPSVTYAGPDSATASFTGSCRDHAGNFASRTFGLKYDETAPRVTEAAAERPPNEAGWYNRPVSVTFRGADQTAGVGGCTSTTYKGPDSATASLTGSCTDEAGNASGPETIALKYDETLPQVTDAAAARPPNDAGWYNRPVSVGFNGRDLTSGINACSTGTYSGPDSASADLAGTCTDKAGNTSGSLRFGLKYDQTEPAVTGAIPERPPDDGAWFTSPVRFDFTGTDVASGLLECPKVTYLGPDSHNALVTGRCHDRAGNSSSRDFPLSFDATAPRLMDLKATPGDRRVALSWQVTPDAELVQLLRTPGLDLDAVTELFRGLETIFVDTRVDNGVRYAYHVRVEDAAGNASSETVSAVPTAPPPGVGVESVPPSGSRSAPTRPRGRHLIAPPPGAVVWTDHPPLLRWTRVPRATYYNLQLFRGRRKILSAWPSSARYQLKTRWRYHGRKRRLVPGRYHWIVWPGFGPRSKTNYGKRIGHSAFQVRRLAKGK
jgi:hypothetical protein